jgi:hypothetical protein
MVFESEFMISRADYGAEVDSNIFFLPLSVYFVGELAMSIVEFIKCDLLLFGSYIDCLSLAFLIASSYPLFY